MYLNSEVKAVAGSFLSLSAGASFLTLSYNLSLIVITVNTQSLFASGTQSHWLNVWAWAWLIRHSGFEAWQLANHSFIEACYGMF